MRRSATYGHSTWRIGLPITTCFSLFVRWWSKNVSCTHQLHIPSSSKKDFTLSRLEAKKGNMSRAMKHACVTERRQTTDQPAWRKVCTFSQSRPEPLDHPLSLTDPGDDVTVQRPNEYIQSIQLSEGDGVKDCLYHRIIASSECVSQPPVLPYHSASWATSTQGQTCPRVVHYVVRHRILGLLHNQHSERVFLAAATPRTPR
jgi:hypothetical protein